MRTREDIQRDLDNGIEIFSAEDVSSLLQSQNITLSGSETGALARFLADQVIFTLELPDHGWNSIPFKDWHANRRIIFGNRLKREFRDILQGLAEAHIPLEAPLDMPMAAPDFKHRNTPSGGDEQ